MTEEIIRYSVEAHNYTPRQVADEFAAKFFDYPRYVRQFNDANNKFSLVGGVSVYEVRHTSSGPVRINCYHVVQLLNSSSIE